MDIFKMLNVEKITAMVKNRDSIEHQLSAAHYADPKWEEEGYLISAPLDKDADGFVADSFNYLVENEYIDKDDRLACIEKGVFTEVSAEYLTGLLLRYHRVLDQDSIAELEGIRNGIIISNHWNNRMGYFETDKGMYFYAWDTTA